MTMKKLLSLFVLGAVVSGISGYVWRNMEHEGLEATSTSIRESIRGGVFIDSVRAEFVPDAENWDLVMIVKNCWLERNWRSEGILFPKKVPSPTGQQLCLVIESENLSEHYQNWSIGSTSGSNTGHILTPYQQSGQQPDLTYLHYTTQALPMVDTFNIIALTKGVGTVYTKAGKIVFRRRLKNVRAL